MIYLRPVVYFDITDLLEYARYNTSLSGIQRMTTMMLNRIVVSRGVAAIRLIAYDRQSNSICWFPADNFNGRFEYEQEAFLDGFGIKPQPKVSLNAYLTLKYEGSFRRRLHGWRLRFINRLDGGRSFAKRKIDAHAPDLVAVESEPRGEAFEARAGDVIFVPGATWDFPDYVAQLRLARAKGVRVIQFVHDLIPIVACEHYNGRLSARFASWFESMLEISSAFFVNSQATARDIRRHVAGRPGDSPEITVLPLAHQYQGFERPGGRALSQSTASNASPERPYVLAVGTLEKRKNLLRLLRVWERMRLQWKSDLPMLVLAGKRGFGCDEIMHFLQRSAVLAGCVQVIEKPDDGALADLYRNCLFTTFASHYEGWGLPVGESLWFGKPVVASRATSLPEVGGRLADYFDPASDLEMQAALERMIFDVAHRHDCIAAILRAPLRSWDDVTEDLWEALGAFTRADEVMNRDTAA